MDLMGVMGLTGVVDASHGSGDSTPRSRARVDEQRYLRLLGLPSHTADPVTIITAAQVRLRRWRRCQRPPRRSPRISSRIRRIMEARDVLLRRQASAEGGFSGEVATLPR